MCVNTAHLSESKESTFDNSSMRPVTFERKRLHLCSLRLHASVASLGSNGVFIFIGPLLYTVYALEVRSDVVCFFIRWGCMGRILVLRVIFLEMEARSGSIRHQTKED